jgi:hypothetical protein
MTTLVSLLGFFLLLALLVLWGVAFWKRPQLATGVLIGVVGAAVVVGIFRAVQLHEIPVWLPALPFAVVALTLFFFGFLAWYWGRTD